MDSAFPQLVNPVNPSSEPWETPWPENVLLNAEPRWVFKPARGFDDHVLKVPQSDWVKLLDQAGYQKTIFVEIKGPDDDALGAALKHMKDAQAAFLRGSYAHAVAECRKALESAIPDADFCPWEETKNRDARENMTAKARFRLSWCAIRHITHSAHHPDGIKDEFSRSMAQYVLHATYLALSLLSKESDLFVKPERSCPAG